MRALVTSATAAVELVKWCATPGMFGVLIENAVVAESVGDDGGAGLADPGVTGRVLLERRGVQQRLPGWVGVGGRVAVGVGVLDGGDGAPGVVVVLRVPDRDDGVDHGDGGLGEDAGGVGE